MLKYLQFHAACDYAFGAFMIVWIIARHVLYLRAVYSIYAHIPQEITYGCYWGSNKDLQGPIEVPHDFNHLLQPFLNPQGLVCWDNRIKWTFITALLALQVILLIWFGMIMRVALKVIRGGEAEDSRSDDEGSDNDEEQEESGEAEEGRSSSQKARGVIEVSPPPLEEE
ncbi:MAG: hypothetical protein Q9190_002665, partial [Brigantiaea leucoxantha]